MIGIRTPFRMSFIGGGSDLKEFYSRSPGCVISTTINKYMYIFIHPFFDDRIQIKYSKTELVDRIEEIKHPIVKEVLKIFDLSGLDVNSIADIPAGTGLGSSSSFTVGLLHALYKYTNQQVTPELLARKACKIEIDILKEPIGKQDQYVAAFGGLRFLEFGPQDQIHTERLPIAPQLQSRLTDRLLLFFTNRTRKSDGILAEQQHNIPDRLEVLHQLRDLAHSGRRQLAEGDLDGFGRNLDTAWELKKRLASGVSDSELDDLYKRARDAGALGGKIAGAGGGGFLLLYAPPSYQDPVREALQPLRELPVAFEPDGSKVIFNIRR